MAAQSKYSTRYDDHQGFVQSHKGKTKDDQVYLITGASESVAADSQRRNRLYAVSIGIRIVSIFLVLVTEGWLQLTILVVGMLAPWLGVQIANTIRQVDGRSVVTIPPQQAAIEAATQEANQADDETVIVGDFVVVDEDETSSTPSAESDAADEELNENKKDYDDTGS